MYLWLRSPVLYGAKFSFLHPFWTYAVCELAVEPPSDNDEEGINHQDIFNVFLDIVARYHLGDGLQESLTREQFQGVGLRCHLILDCPCENVF